MHGMWKPSKRLATPEEGPCSTQSFTWEIRAKDTKIARIRTRNLVRNLGIYIQSPNTASQDTSVVNLNTNSVTSLIKVRKWPLFDINIISTDKSPSYTSLFFSFLYLIPRGLSYLATAKYSAHTLLLPYTVHIPCYCHIQCTYLATATYSAHTLLLPHIVHIPCYCHTQWTYLATATYSAHTLLLPHIVHIPTVLHSLTSHILKITDKLRTVQKTTTEVLHINLK
jgi:hypothetical protein